MTDLRQELAQLAAQIGRELSAATVTPHGRGWTLTGVALVDGSDSRRVDLSISYARSSSISPTHLSVRTGLRVARRVQLGIGADGAQRIARAIRTGVLSEYPRRWTKCRADRIRRQRMLIAARYEGGPYRLAGSRAEVARLGAWLDEYGDVLTAPPRRLPAGTAPYLAVEDRSGRDHRL